MKRGQEAGDGSVTVSYGIRCHFDQLIRNNFLSRASLSFKGRGAPSLSLNGSIEGARVLIHSRLMACFGPKFKPKFPSPLPSPIRLRNRSELASEPDVNVKFSQVRISGSSPEVRLSRYLPSVWRQRVIPSSAPRKNHTSETSHLAGPNRDVGPADRCESVAAVLRKSAFCGASSVTRLKDLSVPRDGSLTKATTKSSSSGDGVSARR